MLTNAVPANATPLPVVRPPLEDEPKHDTVSYLPTWAAAVGRTTADIAALVFSLPLSQGLRAVFEDQVRQEVAAELLAVLEVTDAEAERLEDIACLAFERRLSRHSILMPFGGEA